MIRENVRVWLATAPLDMRRGFDRLAEQVRTLLSQDPMCGHLFVFGNRSRERLKILWWDQGGYCIYCKRLEKGTFQFPSSTEKSIALSSQQLLKLLSGCTIAPS
jgi:transposase